MLLSAGRLRSQEPAPDTVPQRDLMDVLSRVLRGRPDSVVVKPAPKVVLSLLPAFGYNPANGFLLGVSGNAFTRLGPPETTNASTVTASVNYTSKKQFNILVRSNIFGPGNKWLSQGDWRYQDTSQPTYGLGPALPESYKDEMKFKVIRIYETLYRPLSGKLMAGLGYHLNSYFNIVDPNAEQGLPSPFLDYHNGQVVTTELSSGLSANLVLDNRDSPIYGTDGYYAVMSFRTFPKWLGSYTSWQSFQTDFRGYTRVGPSKRGVFALWTTGWFTFGEVPYMELPAIGWDTYGRSGRGYTQGRIRGKNQFYLEGEYRVTLSRDGLFGAAGFVNLTSTSDTLTGGFERVDPGVGLGLRLKLNKRSHTNITLDFGWGHQGSNGLFLGTGEAF